MWSTDRSCRVLAPYSDTLPRGGSSLACTEGWIQARGRPTRCEAACISTAGWAGASRRLTAPAVEGMKRGHDDHGFASGKELAAQKPALAVDAGIAMALKGAHDHREEAEKLADASRFAPDRAARSARHTLGGGRQGVATVSSVVRHRGQARNRSSAVMARARLQTPWSSAWPTPILTVSDGGATGIPV